MSRFGDWLKTTGTRPMDGFEYQKMYDYGLMPERFWPWEIEKLKGQYLADEITLADFERELEALLDVRGLEAVHA